MNFSKIKLYKMLLLILVISNITKAQASLNAKVCNIFIHGYTSESIEYFGSLPNQVQWDSTKQLKEAAVEVAKKIVTTSSNCNDLPVILRPHSYGAPVVSYILGKGALFENFYPEHDFVKVYKKTIAVYSYTGAYRGTPLMDLICNKVYIRTIANFFDAPCVPSLTTNKIEHFTSQVTSPNVPTLILYSSDRSEYFGIPGLILSKTGVGWRSFIFGERNQNDSVLPQYSTKACAETEPILEEEGNCRKIDSNFFIDHSKIENYSHNEFLLDENVMTRGNE